MRIDGVLIQRPAGSWTPSNGTRWAGLSAAFAPVLGACGLDLSLSTDFEFESE